MQFLKNSFKKHISRRGFLFTALVVVLCCSIGLASAFYLYNGVGEKSIGLKMSDFTGTTTSNVITNNTDRTVYARAYILPYWQTTDSTCTEDYVGLEEWSVSDKINSGELVVNDTDWYQSGNYYYYKKTLAPDETTTELVSSFSGSNAVSYERNSKYKPTIFLANNHESNKYNSNNTKIYPHLKYFDYTTRDETEVKVFQGTRNTINNLPKSYTSGSGTVADPYIITTGEELLKCVTSTGVADNGAQLYFKLGADIYLNDPEALSNKNTKALNQWVMSSDSKTRFCGVFDGNGYTVNGLFLAQRFGNTCKLNSNVMFNYTDEQLAQLMTACRNNTDDYDHAKTRTFGGLFPCLGPGAVVKNVGISDSIIWNVPYAGFIAGYVCARSTTDDPVTIENCYVQNCEITHSGVDGDAIGGFVGYAEFNINNPSPNTLLYLNNVYYAGKFDFSTDHEKLENSTTKQYRTATVGAMNTNYTEVCKVNNGYFYCTIQSSVENYYSVMSSAPVGVTATNFFNQNKTSNMGTYYNEIKNALGNIKTDIGNDTVWSFNNIVESAYPKDGLLVATDLQVAKQAYRVAFELLQYDGATDSATNSKSPVSDAWGSDIEGIVTNTSVETLNSQFTFYSAENYASRTTAWGDTSKQPTLSSLTSGYMRYSPLISGRTQASSLIMDGTENIDKDNDPIMTYIVEAPIAGRYTIAPEFVSNVSSGMFALISVNDRKYQRNNFAITEQMGGVYYSANTSIVQLEKGVNVIRIIMPADALGANDVTSTLINFNGLWIQNNANALTVQAQKSTVVNYVNADKTDITVAYKNYHNTADANYVGEGSVSAAIDGIVTSENLKGNNFELIPYTMFKVNNSGAAGYYDIELSYNTYAGANPHNSGYIIVRVNGINNKFKFKSYHYGDGGNGTSVSKLNITSYLESGVNNITITAPLEVAVGEGQNAKWRYVAWFNQYNVTFHGYGESASNITWIEDKNISPAVTDPDVENLSAEHETVLEAEEYGILTRYNQVESAGNATVIGGIVPEYGLLPDWSSMPSDKFTQRNDSYYLNDSASAHIDYYIYAPKAGNYKIKPRVYFAFDNNDYSNGCTFYIMVNESFKKIVVNSSEFRVDDQGRCWYNTELELPLKAGLNVFRIIPFDSTNSFRSASVTYKTKWMNHDYIELLDDSLIGVKSQSQYRGALKAHYIYGYAGAAYDGSNGTTTGYNKGDGTFKDEEIYAAYQLKHISSTEDLKGGWYNYGNTDPNANSLYIFSIYQYDNAANGQEGGGLPGVSYTVKVPTDGYYPLTLSQMSNVKGLLHYSVFVNSDNTNYWIPFNVQGVLGSGCLSDCSVYLKAGINTITLSVPRDGRFLSDTANWYDFGALHVRAGIEFTPYKAGINPHPSKSGISYCGSRTTATLKSWASRYPTDADK